jgi:hypothetical protein
MYSSTILAVEFSQPLTNLSLAFFTGDVSSEYDIPTKVRLTAYTNSAMTSPLATTNGQGDWLTGAYPEGTMSLGSVIPFTTVKIDMPPGQGRVSYLLFVDNIVAQQVARPPVTITASASPTNGGTIDGAGTVAQGTSVTVTATENPGYDFVGWTENNALVSGRADYSFNATTNRLLPVGTIVGSTIRRA